MLKKALFSPLFLFIVIVLASSIFRITNLDLIEFKKDEAINLFLATRPFFGHPFPPGATVSSIGILNPPILNYLIFPPLFISWNPIFVSFYIGLINSLSIGFLFLIIRRFYNVWIALIATLLMAFSPWAILFSRKIWAQDFIIPLFIPLFYSLHKIVIDKKQFYWLPFTVFSLFLIQLHQAIIFFIVLLVVFLILGKNKLNFKYIVMGIIIGFVPLIPYIAYQITNSCPDCEALMSANKRLLKNDLNLLLLRLLQITNSGNFYSIIGDDMITFLDRFPFIYKARSLFYLEYILLPLSLLIFFVKFRKLRLLIFSTVFLPFIYFLLKIEAFMHYFIILVPILFLSLGISFYYLLSKKNIFIKLISFLILSLILGESIAFNFSFFKILSINGSLRGDYGISFREIEKDTNKKFSKYKNDKNYQEMILSSYLPKDLMFGYLPISQMLFKRAETERRLKFLEGNLRKNPVDNLTEVELLAYYTPIIPDNKSVEIIRQKVKENPDYTMIYNLAFKDYLQKKYLKTFDDKSFGIAFEYPEHWKKEINEKGEIEVKNEEYVLNIKIIDRNKNKQNMKYMTLKDIASNKVKKEICTTKGKEWCGEILEPVEINNRIFEIKYINHSKQLLYPNDKETEFIIKVMDSIISSLRAN